MIFHVINAFSNLVNYVFSRWRWKLKTLTLLLSFGAIGNNVSDISGHYTIHLIEFVARLGFQRLRDLLNSGMKKEAFGNFYRTTIRSGKKRKKVLEEYRKN